MEFHPYRRRFQALVDVARQARDRGDAQAGLVALTRGITEVLRADRSTLFLIDELTGELRSRVVEGAPGLDIRVAVGTGLAGWVAMTGIPLRINDVLADDRFDSRWDQKSGYRTQNVVVVPLLGPNGKVIGVIQSLNKRGGFTDEDEDLLTAVAAITALAVEVAWKGRTPSPAPRRD